MSKLKNKWGMSLGPHNQPFKISILNDNPNWGQLEVIELRKQGYTVTVYPSTTGLLPFLNLPNLFILNITHPQTNKFQLVEGIRAASTQVGILLTLEKDVSEDRAQAFTSGADNFIVQPYAIEEFLAIVSSLHRRLQW
jgi:DNA-binding response OmpR family regulator